MRNNLIPISCALGCSFLWGTTFVAQDTGMDFIGPYTFCASRLFIGFFGLLPFLIYFEFDKLKQINFNFQKVLLYTLILGSIFGLANIFQQVSLLYTDIANSAVFTVLYVVIVPVVSYFIFSLKVHSSIWPSVTLCLIGGLLLSEIKNYDVRYGDTLVIIGAFFWAFHIIFISKILKFFNFPIAIATFQCLVAGIFCSVPALALETVSISLISKEIKELLYAGILSSGVAFMLQAYAQRVLQPASVAIIFSLEGVFASIFGWIILDQFLNEIKIFGILIILLAVIFSQLMPIYGKKKYGRI
ncbi:MAG: EamA family transporter [Candidatus Pelagibacter sp.]|nr:EamA family transporter [Candidatus Pelagibacter sp.]OUW23421.1 MAG: EamA family transporter [Rickettsiales bacterium TMED174]|tara:strand:- start:208 stop:1110 length:903 start_codon:yes stop_codon:yes gene_type:complete